MATNRAEIGIGTDTLAIDPRDGLGLLADTDYTTLKQAATSGSIDISIVIPIHNESEALRVLIPSLVSEIHSLPDKTFEVLLVDDASTDDSREIIESYIEDFDFLHLVDLEVRGGQTEAFREGFRLATGRFIMRMDGDMQDDPSDLKNFVTKIDDGHDVVVGIREARKHLRIYKVVSRLFDLIVLMLMDTPFRENSASFVAFKADKIKDVPLKPFDHRFLIIIALSQGVEKPGEIIVKHNQRLGGKSKYRAISKFMLGCTQLIRVLLRISLGYYNKRETAQ
jgi:glycosyltransferase involved in cell wall biosynthesis